MKIILQEEVRGLGVVGEVVEVKPGYARNYLLPHGLALPATEGNLRRVERARSRRTLLHARAKEAAEVFAARLKDVSVTITKKVGEGQTLYGSVTEAEIAEALRAQGFAAVERKQIEIAEPIKMLGIYDVPVVLHPEVRPVVKVWVVKEE